MQYCKSTSEFNVEDFAASVTHVKPAAKRKVLMEAISKNPDVAIYAARYVFCESNGEKLIPKPYHSLCQLFWYSVRDINRRNNNEINKHIVEWAEENQKFAEDFYNAFMKYLRENEFIRLAMAKRGLYLFEFLEQGCKYKELIGKLMRAEYYEAFNVSAKTNEVLEYIRSKIYSIHFLTIKDEMDDYKASLDGEERKLYESDTVRELLRFAENQIEYIKKQVLSLIFDE